MLRLFIIAGEISGDNHGSQVIKELKTISQDVIVEGWGGDEMHRSGAKIHKHVKELNLMGFTDVILRLPKIIGLFSLCKKQIKGFSPDSILFIDYSGFNLRMAQWAKKQNITTHFYIAPKTWAWNSSRNRKIEKNVDHLYCILPFEEDYFKKFGIRASYVGNPLSKLGSGSESRLKNTIALLPGSRLQEVKKSLPVFGKLINLNPSIHWIIACVPHISHELYLKYLGLSTDANLQFITNKTHDILSTSSLAIITSGTATLEAALLNCPQIVVYRTSWLNYFIGKIFIRTKFISLPNIILDKRIVSELIQNDFNVNFLEETMTSLLDQKNRKRQFNSYKEIKSRLGDKNAAYNVAKSIIRSYSK